MQPIPALSPAAPSTPATLPGLIESEDISFDLLIGPEFAEVGRTIAEPQGLAGIQSPLLLPLAAPMTAAGLVSVATAVPGPGGSGAPMPDLGSEAGAEALPAARPDATPSVTIGAARLGGASGPDLPTLVNAHAQASSMPEPQASARPASPLSDDAVKSGLSVKAAEAAGTSVPALVGSVPGRLADVARGPTQRPNARVAEAPDPVPSTAPEAKGPDGPDAAEPSSGLPAPEPRRSQQGAWQGDPEPAAADRGPVPVARPADGAMPLAPVPLPVTASQGRTQASLPAAVPLSLLPAAVVSAMTSGEGITIDLSPADLGRLRIELPISSGSGEVRLMVERAETLSLVQKAAEALAEDLRKAGIIAQSVTVELLVPDRTDPARADVARPDAGGQAAPSGAGAGGAGPQDRSGTASPDSSAGSYRGSGGGTAGGAAPPAPGDPHHATAAERLDLRL